MKLNSLLPFLLSFFTTSSKRFMALVKKPLREREGSFCTVSWVSHFPPNSWFSFCKERWLFCSALTGRAAITRVCRVGRSVYGQALSGKLNSFNEKIAWDRKAGNAIWPKKGRNTDGTRASHSCPGRSFSPAPPSIPA